MGSRAPVAHATPVRSSGRPPTVSRISAFVARSCVVGPRVPCVSPLGFGRGSSSHISRQNASSLRALRALDPCSTSAAHCAACVYGTSPCLQSHPFSLHASAFPLLGVRLRHARARTRARARALPSSPLPVLPLWCLRLEVRLEPGETARAGVRRACEGGRGGGGGRRIVSRHEAASALPTFPQPSGLCPP